MSRIREILQREAYRQWRKLILIPSESICNPVAAEVLSSPFVSVYAEGQPDPVLLQNSRESAADANRFESWYTRLANGRFYKGCLEADRAELLAQEYIARIFAPADGSVGAEDMHVNAQALSGAAANTAVYSSLLEHGDRIMGLDLAAGGHLTHGSEYNLSGKTYDVVSYGIDENTRRLDYDRIRALAGKHKPKLIIGGASAYPWDFDWKALRAIADGVGALLLADIAHLAGMVAAGILNNPVGVADVVTFTTHKSYQGPRGAAIITTDRNLCAKIKAGVFPGLQGGPHVQSIAAIAAQSEWILENRDEFVAQQRKIVENAKVLADAIEKEGFTLEYGGTNTHLFLIDLKKFETPGDGRLDGEIASRLLEIAGIVCNKNALPGDPSGGRATGLRMGTPWITQRGVTAGQLGEIAAVTRLVLEAIHTTHIITPSDEDRCRGRILPEVLEEAARRTLAVAEALPHPAKPEEPPADEIGDTMLLRGDKVRLALDQMLTCSAVGLAPGENTRGNLLRPNGEVIDTVSIKRLENEGREERAALRCSPGKSNVVASWIRGLSDGYVMFDKRDLCAKIDGPTVVEPAPAGTDIDDSSDPLVVAEKPYFIGQESVPAEAGDKSAYVYQPEDQPVRKTALNDFHRERRAKMVEFAGWDMPVQYEGSIFAEHNAVRTGAGLFDVSHMRTVKVKGDLALPFLDTLLANCASRLDPGQAQYGYLLYPSGVAIDDLFLYRLAADEFMLVFNAANADEDLAWIRAVQSGEYLIDNDMPARKAPGPVEVIDLHDAGADSLGGSALQGPRSRDILLRICDTPDRLKRLIANEFITCRLDGIDATVAYTGYTGEPVGFEIYVHPDRMRDLWNALIEKGAEPCGLGARDSTRVQAGLPLFGHELEGDCTLTLTAAGYGFVPKFHKPFFIGRAAYIRRVINRSQKIIRLKGHGRKSIRPGHVILGEGDRTVGRVTSFAFVNKHFDYFALAAIDRTIDIQPGTKIRAARLAFGGRVGPLDEKSVVTLEAEERFPSDGERAAWAG